MKENSIDPKNYLVQPYYGSNVYDVDNLYIKSITVDGGPVFKRWKPAAYGRAVPRLKRTSHLTVVVSNKQN